MNVSYFLTRPTGKNESGIYARLCYAGQKFKYYLPEKIDPKFWNKESQRAKQTAKFIEHPEFNARLDNWVSTIKNIYRKHLNDNAGAIPTRDTLRALFDIEIKKKESAKTKAKTFVEFFEGIIDQTRKGLRTNHSTGKAISPNTLKTYVSTYRHLLDYQKTLKRDIQFKDIDLDFYNDYSEYLIKTMLLGSSIGKDIKIIKMVMNDATERGANTNLAFKSKRFAVIKQDSESIYLNEDELREMQSLDLAKDKPLERVRDLFLIGARTGLRFSDLSKLKAENIKDGFINITQTKTGQRVVIPEHKAVRQIMNNYNGNLPPSISNQKMNDYLKKIGKLMPSLNISSDIFSKKAGLKNSDAFAKWELLTTHTARRSFATNQYKAGIPAITIMSITGHSTEKSFLKYIKLAPTGHAKIVKDIWDKQSPLAAVK
jgi:integrase